MPERLREREPAPTHGQESLIQVSQSSLARPFPRPAQLRRLKGFPRLWIGHLVLIPLVRKFAPPAAAGGVGYLRILEGTEVREGTRLVVFLAHENQRDRRREEQKPGRQPLLLRLENRPQPVAARPIADLV